MNRSLKNLVLLGIISIFLIGCCELFNNCPPPECDIQLEISNAISGKPLSGVSITLNAENNGIKTGTSNDHGFYKFESLTPDKFSVILTKSGYETFTSEVFVVQDDESYILEQALRPTQSNLTVTVKDSLGNMLEGATVKISPTISLQTNSQGVAIFENLDEGTYTISAELPGYEAKDIEKELLGGKAGSAEITMRPVFSHLTIKVTDGLNSLSAVPVSLSDGTNLSTNEHGIVTYTNINEGTYTITIDYAGYQLVTKDITITGGKPSNVTIQLTEKYGTIEGEILDMETEEPIRLASVALGSYDPLATGSNGTFKFQDLNPGEYNLTITKDGYEPHEGDILVEAGKTVKPVIILTPINPCIELNVPQIDFGTENTILPLEITNGCKGELSWNVSEDITWLGFNPPFGKVTTGISDVDVIINRDLLECGKKQRTITFGGNGGGSNTYYQRRTIM